MKSHHPDATTLMEYSAGQLSQPHALAIQMHITECGRCRSKVDTLECLGAVLLENQATTSMSALAFDNLLDRIDALDPEGKVDERDTRSPLEKLLGNDLNGLPWKKQLGDVSVLDISDLFPDQDEQVVLQRLCAGGKAPAHTHRGNETSIVLQGAFVDGRGQFNQWDYVCLDGNDDHQPRAVGNEYCITLSILSAPVKLTGRFTRFLNPLIR